jgi:hypothetical protein
MLSIETVKPALTELGALPVGSRIGLAVMLVAGVMDTVVHLLGNGGHAAHHGLFPEHAAHVMGIVGMVLVLAGVVINGARRQLSRRAPAAINGGLDRNAPR